jgi:glycosyltransferase involved in cell wall biosynthesis
MLRVSFIICTFNRADILPRCLNAACRQTLPASDYEVIVVDNASNDHTRAIVERVAACTPKPVVRYLHEIARGLSYARNAGARAARAPIVTYIDDDAIAAPGLLSEIVSAFSPPDAGAVGGRIDLKLPEELPRWYSAFFDGYYSKLDLGFTETTKVTEVWQYPYGANMSFSRAALEQIGFFNTAMGRIGRDSSGGEDIDAICRVARLGYAIYHNPNAMVEHIIMPSRIHWRHIASTARAAGRNWAYYEMELLGSRGRLWPDVLALASTCKNMSRAALARSLKRWCIPYSQFLFCRSKLARKIKYRLLPAR